MSLRLLQVLRCMKFRTLDRSASLVRVLHATLLCNLPICFRSPICPGIYLRALYVRVSIELDSCLYPVAALNSFAKALGVPVFNQRQ